MATKITKAKTPKKAPTRKRTMPTPANKPKQGWPKDRIRAAYTEKGADAARALGEELGITKGRLNRWIEREWPGKAAPKPTTTKKTGKATGRKVEAVQSNGRQTVKAAAS